MAFTKSRYGNILHFDAAAQSYSVGDAPLNVIALNYHGVSAPGHEGVFTEGLGGQEIFHLTASGANEDISLTFSQPVQVGGLYLLTLDSGELTVYIE